jgi:hypothetical protein
MMTQKRREQAVVWRKANREKIRKRQIAWTKANREKIARQHVVWNKENSEKNRLARCTRVYGVGSYEHFQQQIDMQSNCCAICGDSFVPSLNPHRDHNHETKQWRGALCKGCNAGLGNFKEDPRRFLAAVKYLETWENLYRD